jgi:hypothetical protein
MPANPCPVRLCEESFLRALRASVGARTPFGHLSTLPRCIAPIRAPSGLSGGLSTLERVAGRARRVVLGVPTMRTSAQAPLRRSQSPAGVAGAWTHPNDYLRPHTGSQWALTGRWAPVLGLGHGLLRGHWGGVTGARRGHGVTGAQAGRGLGGCESVTGRVRKILYERLRVRTRRAGAGGAHGAGAPARACKGCVVLGCVFVSLFTIQVLPNPQTIKQSLTNPQQQNPNPQHRTRKKRNNRWRIRTAPNPPQAHRRSDGGAQDITETFAGIGRGSKNEVGFLGTSVFWRHRNYASVSVGTLWGHYRNSIGSRRGLTITETEKPPPRRARAPVGGSLCC